MNTAEVLAKTLWHHDGDEIKLTALFKRFKDAEIHLLKRNLESSERHIRNSLGLITGMIDGLTAEQEMRAEKREQKRSRKT